MCWVQDLLQVGKTSQQLVRFTFHISQGRNCSCTNSSFLSVFSSLVNFVLSSLSDRTHLMKIQSKARKRISVLFYPFSQLMWKIEWHKIVSCKELFFIFWKSDNINLRCFPSHFIILQVFFLSCLLSASCLWVCCSSRLVGSALTKYLAEAVTSKYVRSNV